MAAAMTRRSARGVVALIGPASCATRPRRCLASPFPPQSRRPRQKRRRRRSQKLRWQQACYVFYVSQHFQTSSNFTVSKSKPS